MCVQGGKSFSFGLRRVFKIEVLFNNLAIKAVTIFATYNTTKYCILFF